jgi:hypothetical protein
MAFAVIPAVRVAVALVPADAFLAAATAAEAIMTEIIRSLLWFHTQANSRLCLLNTKLTMHCFTQGATFNIPIMLLITTRTIAQLTVVVLLIKANITWNLLMEARRENRGSLRILKCLGRK